MGDIIRTEGTLVAGTPSAQSMATRWQNYNWLSGDFSPLYPVHDIIRTEATGVSPVLRPAFMHSVVLTRRAATHRPCLKASMANCAEQQVLLRPMAAVTMLVWK